MPNDASVKRNALPTFVYMRTCACAAYTASRARRDRASDVASPERLAELHPVYRERVVQGPSYPADMWAALTQDDSLTPAELARGTYGSFATAWEVRRDWDVVRAKAA